jgi:uncharacterized DUF497 family protein
MAGDFELLAAAGFEWDEVKSNANLVKHGISFDDASEIFYGPVVVKNSTRNNEERWIAIGISRSDRDSDFHSTKRFHQDHFGAPSEAR